MQAIFEMAGKEYPLFLGFQYKDLNDSWNKYQGEMSFANLNFTYSGSNGQVETISDWDKLQDLVNTHDIGVIGYFSGHPVIDLVGLFNPDVVKYHEGRRLREYIDKTKPDYIVLFGSWEFAFLHIGLNPFIFETIHEFPGGSEPYILYRTHFPP